MSERKKSKTKEKSGTAKKEGTISPDLNDFTNLPEGFMPMDQNTPSLMANAASDFEHIYHQPSLLPPGTPAPEQSPPAQPEAAEPPPHPPPPIEVHVVQEQHHQEQHHQQQHQGQHHGQHQRRQSSPSPGPSTPHESKPESVKVQGSGTVRKGKPNKTKSGKTLKERFEQLKVKSGKSGKIPGDLSSSPKTPGTRQGPPIEPFDEESYMKAIAEGNVFFIDPWNGQKVVYPRKL